MKYLVIASLVFLAACKTETTGDKVNGFETACMAGVLYYVDKSGYGKSLAPVIDADTLTYVRCEVK